MIKLAIVLKILKSSCNTDSIVSCAVCFYNYIAILQDHNYGAPPPASPPPRVPSPSVFVDKINGHIEVEEISVTSIGQQASVDVISDTVDDSITRCICDFTHDDGYMICCDKCRYDLFNPFVFESSLLSFVCVS